MTYDEDLPTLLMLGTGDSLLRALQEALASHATFVEAAPSESPLAAVLAAAPDLVVLLGDAAERANEILKELHGNALTSVVPVAVLTEQAGFEARLSAIRQGAVAVVQKTASVDEMARRLADLARELPERSAEQSEELGEATVDELVETLSKELRSGILSVSSGEGGLPSSRFVLRAGKPVSEAIADFVKRVKPLVQATQPLRFELLENPKGGISVLDEDTVEASATEAQDVFRDRRILLVDDNPANADVLAQELRLHGAKVVVTDGRGGGLERARSLNPEIVLVDEEGLNGWAFDVMKALHDDILLRWASVLVVRREELFPAGAETPRMKRLAAGVQGLLRPDDELRKRALSGKAFDVRLETLGPARMLRVLAATGATLHLVVRNRRATIDIDLAQELVASADVVRLVGSPNRPGGPTALATFLALASGRVNVVPQDHPKSANMLTPIDDAIAVALADSAPIQPSMLPPAAEAGASALALPKAPAVPNDAVPNDAVPNDAVPNDAVPNDAVPNVGGYKPPSPAGAPRRAKRPGVPDQGAKGPYEAPGGGKRAVASSPSLGRGLAVPGPTAAAHSGGPRRKATQLGMPMAPPPVAAATQGFEAPSSQLDTRAPSSPLQPPPVASAAAAPRIPAAVRSALMGPEPTGERQTARRAAKGPSSPDASLEDEVDFAVDDLATVETPLPPAILRESDLFGAEPTTGEASSQPLAGGPSVVEHYAERDAEAFMPELAEQGSDYDATGPEITAGASMGGGLRADAAEPEISPPSSPFAPAHADRDRSMTTVAAVEVGSLAREKSLVAPLVVGLAVLTVAGALLFLVTSGDSESTDLGAMASAAQGVRADETAPKAAPEPPPPSASVAAEAEQAEAAQAEVGQAEAAEEATAAAADEFAAADADAAAATAGAEASEAVEAEKDVSEDDAKGSGDVDENLENDTSLSARERAFRLVDAGNFLRGAGRTKVAIRRYEAALRLDPRNGRALAGLIKCHMAMRDTGTAVRLALLLVREHPTQAGNRVLLGDALAADGKTDRARRAWRAALDINPRHPGAKRRLGR